ncbi:MAG: zf-HC2 domain-containing protein [Vicinamibacterales bacterium]
MECREVRRLADAYLSDQLLVETSQAIAAHLDTCPPCRAEIEGLRRLRASVRSAVHRATDEPLRPEFSAALTERLRTQAERSTAATTGRRGWLAAAASLLLAAATGVGAQQWGARAFNALVLAAAGNHQNCALTFKLSEEPIELDEAARRFGGAHQALARVPLPAATAPGEAITEVERHSCEYAGQRFVHLVLRYKRETVSVLVTAEPRPRLASLGLARDGLVGDVRREGGFTLTSFTGARHAAFVVSTLGANDVREVAQAVAGPITRALAGA